MIELEIGFIISAFIAGIVMFLAPCTLPIVPAYLGFISGVSLKDLALLEGKERKKAQRRIFLNGVAFILGFTLIFVLFGTLAGLLGEALAPVRIWLARIGGLLVIVFGLFMLGVFDFKFLQKEKRLQVPSFMKIGSPATSFGIGSAFAFGWTPCVGPILASILLLASTSSTAFQGGFLLLIFSLGLAVPFLIVAAATSYASLFIERGGKYLKYVSMIGGVFLIGLGLLLISDNFGLLLQWGYQYFDFLNYEALLDYL